MNPQFSNLVNRAESITAKLAERRDSTAAPEAAKQLSTIIRTAKRNFALGHEAKALESLDWAA